MNYFSVKQRYLEIIKKNITLEGLVIFIEIKTNCCFSHFPSSRTKYSTSTSKGGEVSLAHSFQESVHGLLVLRQNNMVDGHGGRARQRTVAPHITARKQCKTLRRIWGEEYTLSISTGPTLPIRPCP